MALTTIPHPERIVDVLFPVSGDVLRPGYGYPLYSAVKGVDDELAADPAILLGPIEGTGLYPGLRDLIRILPGTRWRVRCEMRLLRRVLDLEGARLLVGSHEIVLGRPLVDPLIPASTMHAEMIVLRWPHLEAAGQTPTLREFEGYLRRLLRDRRVQWMPQIGRRRSLAVGEHGESIGWAVEVRGLDEPQAIALQARIVGVRGHMGAGMFVPGPLPGWLEVSDEVGRQSRRGHGAGRG